MDDQIRRLMTSQTTSDRFRGPVEISQACLMPLGVAQCLSAIDTDIPGVITMHIVFLLFRASLGRKRGFVLTAG